MAKPTHILIKGAREHNLKNIDVQIPRNKMVVITGVSGSGKSSLAFDTLFAEGQRRYVESLSSYARQFLGKLEKPNVDEIKGVSPSIAIEQKVVSRSSRSTVGTSTEIYDYIKLMYARIGRTYSPVSGKEVTHDTVTHVVDFIMSKPEGTRVAVLNALKGDKTLKAQLDLFLQQGFSRILVGGDFMRIEDYVPKADEKKEVYLLIDRFSVDLSDDDFAGRLSDSVSTAFYEGEGSCTVRFFTDEGAQDHFFSNKFELDGITFEKPSEHFFSFNSPVGACKTCEGFGSVIGIDPDAVMPDKSLSIFEDAVACWRGEKMSQWKEELVMSASEFDFPIHKPVGDLSKEQLDLLWKGNSHFAGLNAFFQELEAQTYKIQYRVMLSRYRGKTHCPECNGTRLKEETQYVKIDGKNLSDLLLMPIHQLHDFFNDMKLTDFEAKVASRLLEETQSRLQFIKDVGLGYLTLNRASNTLSGGESQRINLAKSLGSSLVGSLYVLDEPSIGLHSRDTVRLVSVLRRLQKIGNTVVIVEHDEDIMEEADEIIDMGPFAGTLGGEVVFQGDKQALIAANQSLTADYLTGKKEIPVPSIKRKPAHFIKIEGAQEFNLKNIDVEFPLEVFTVITGVSGSGKSTLVKKILYPILKRELDQVTEQPGTYKKFGGALDKIEAVEYIDQNPIGKSSRSNPVTYVKAFDEIRGLFSQQAQAKAQGYKPSHFSFNVPGGRCDECEGEGSVTVEMQFIADVHLKCDSCKGFRYKEEILEVLYREKSIYDVLNMTIDEAIAFFEGDIKNSFAKKIVDKLDPLQQVGLGYVKLGQSASTLSGGEAQRIKLASFLSKGGNSKSTLFIFDEPTTGLHFDDINKLLKAFYMLLDKGHSLIVIEHNLDVVKCADWVIDLGPDGGENGGSLLYAGTPEGLADVKESHTARFLAKKF